MFLNDINARIGELDAELEGIATLTDPTGVFASSVRFEAHLESQSNDIHYRNSSFGSEDYRRRSYREMEQCIADKTREELAKIGR